ncbi:MAG TPA: hypothetical protein VFL57_13330, partial [Bryobacteraceae bacterium]|nr:hypothetical protein [Bryobacteraceae bacterium]
MSRQGTLVRQLVWPSALLCLLTGPGACAAEIWRHWQASDGLVEPFTRCLARDSSGRIWAAHGYVKYMSRLDGYTVDHVRAPSATDTGVQIAPNGVAWVSTRSDLERFSGGAWARITVPDPQKGRITAMVVLGEHKIILGYADRIAVFDPTRKSYENVVTVRDTRLGRFRSLVRRNGGGLWVTGAAGIGILNVDAPTREARWSELAVSSRALENFGKVFEARDGSILVPARRKAGKAATLLRHSGGHWTELYRSSARGTEIRAAWIALDNQLWLVDDHDLYSSEDRGWRLVPRAYSLAGEIRDVLVEPDGSFWVATSQGISRCSRRAWLNVATGPESSRTVSHILEDSNGRIWFLKVKALGSVLRDRAVMEYAFPENTQAEPSITESMAILPDGRVVIRTQDARTLMTFDPVTKLFSTTAIPNGASASVL